MRRRPGSGRSAVASGLVALVAVTVAACTAGSDKPAGSAASDATASSASSAISSPSSPRSSAPASSLGSSPSASSPFPAPAGPITDVTVVGTIARGLATPWGLAFLPDGTALVSERDTGTVLAIAPDPGHAVSTIGTVDGVVPGGEGGLLGLAVSTGPDGAPTVFAYYTADGDNRVAVLELAGGGSSPLRLTGQREIVTGIPQASVHNGGRLAIGPDGHLYIGTGDATDSDGAQRLDYLGGKILRVTEDGSPAPGNPFPDAPLVYSFGHRNVQGLAFDAQGRLWADEFGASSYDELNLIRPGGNYGWPVVEGPSDDSRFEAPYRYWPTSDASPSGLAIVAGTAFMAALRGERLWLIALTGNAGAVEPVDRLAGEYGRLRTVVPAPDGTLWLATSNTDGRGDPATDDDRILQLRTS